MKFNNLFEKYLGCDSESEVFKYFQNTLIESINLWDYFVDWQKILQNFKDVEIHLNTLNYLVGKEDVEKEFRHLLKHNHKIISVIPVLIACRTTSFQILSDYTSNDFSYKSFNFNAEGNLSQTNIDDIIEFTENTGLLDLFRNKTLKSIPDYVLGIEVGLDTNARKNRGGKTMETIVKSLISTLCQKNNFQFIPQATSGKIKDQWNIDVKVDKSNRRFDFAVKNHNSLYLIETNFYSGGGSKLKSTAGEYKKLFDFISGQGHKFIWVTDGFGWKSTLRPLEETFNHIDYTMNLKMLTSNLFRDLIAQNL